MKFAKRCRQPLFYLNPLALDLPNKRVLFNKGGGMKGMGFDILIDPALQLHHLNLIFVGISRKHGRDERDIDVAAAPVLSCGKGSKEKGARHFLVILVDVQDKLAGAYQSPLFLRTH